MGNKILKDAGIEKTPYKALNGKQKENYNFHRVSALLSEYGFSCQQLTNDWQSADFVAYGANSNVHYFVQQKSEFTIDKKYEGKDLMICFPLSENSDKWVFIPHDELLSILKKLNVPYFSTPTWQNKGRYYAKSPNKKIIEALEPYIL